MNELKLVMINVADERDVKLGVTVIERVDNYAYLGSKLKLGLDKQTQTAEVKR